MDEAHPSPKKIPLYNPLREDFTVTYDITGDKDPRPFTIHAQEIEYFEPIVARHIVKHLADAVLAERGIRTNYTDDMTAIKKEIEVTV